VKVKDSEFKSQLTPVHHDSLTIAYSTEEGAPKVVQFNHNWHMIFFKPFFAVDLHTTDCLQLSSSVREE
jgi:hypothetical protein